MIKETLSTSEKEIPKINLGLEETYKEQKVEDKTVRAENVTESLIDSLPKPSG